MWCCLTGFIMTDSLHIIIGFWIVSVFAFLPSFTVILLAGLRGWVQTVDVVGQLAIGFEVLGKFLGRPAVAGLGVEGCQHVLSLELAVQMFAVGGKEAVGPLFEVLAHCRHLLAQSDAAKRRHDAALTLGQRQVELQALQHEGDVGLPVLLAIVGTHQVAAQIVADGAR